MLRRGRWPRLEILPTWRHDGDGKDTLTFMQLSFHHGSPIARPPAATALRLRRGMGATDQQITALFGTIGSSIPVAGPFIQAAASVAVAIETMFSGCGQTCVETSQAANQVGALLSQNLSNYLSQPVHYASIQSAALTVFDQAWAQLQQTCGNPQFGAAGQRCISDRQAGACTWKSSTYGWVQGSDGSWKYVQSGPAGSGGQCWNWFSGYRDPIANDPTVVPDPVAGGTTGAGGASISGAAASSSGSSLIPLLLLGVIVFVVVKVA